MKILFVCTGNICRSPMAEGLLRHKLKHAGVKAIVDSCGFEPFHVGDHPDSRAVAVSRKNGINISGHIARLFTEKDFDRFDHIYVMDASHYYHVKALARNNSDMLRVDYLMNLLIPGKNIAVDDPWYHDITAFERAFSKIDAACEEIIKTLLMKH